MPKGKGSITVFHVKNTKQIQGYTVKTQENRLEIGSDKELHPEFAFDNIFSFRMVSKIPLIGRLINKFFNKPIDVVIWREGKMKCESLSNDVLFDPVTDQEKVKIVKRTIALGLEKYKPLATWMFIILFLVNLFILIFQLLAMRGFRIG